MIIVKNNLISVNTVVAAVDTNINNNQSMCSKETIARLQLEKRQLNELLQGSFKFRAKSTIPLDRN